MVGNVRVMKQRIKRLDSWYRHTGFLSKLDGRAKICLDLHRSSRSEVLVHGAVGLGWDEHLFNRRFPKARSEVAPLHHCKLEEFVDDSSDKRADADLLEKFGMRWRLKGDAGWMKSNRSAEMISCCTSNWRNPAQQSATYPIMRSYCCCRMFWDTSQSTFPDLSVIDSASAMSCCIDAGIDGFLFAAPTQSSVDPLCSNSLAPIWEISAPDTNESTTFVGKRDSRYDSMPRVCVVLTRMQVCCGATTASMTEARS